MAAQHKFEIDGSEMEGGGQILRIASALGAVLGVGVRIFNIRGNRSKPGLRAQHLTGLRLLQDVTKGKLEGCVMNSSQIDMKTGRIEGGRFIANVQTAGSVCLLIQSCLPVALYGKTSTNIQLIGGTDVDMAPPIDYTKYVFSRIAEKFGVKFDVNMHSRGFFPKGNGRVDVCVEPLSQPLAPLILTEPGTILSYTITAFVAGKLPKSFAEHLECSAKKSMVKQFGSQLDAAVYHGRAYKETAAVSRHDGAVLHIWMETDTGCHLGSNAVRAKNTSADQMAISAATQIFQDFHTGSCFDRHAQNQIIILMALAKGKSRVRVSPLTMHTQTAMYIVNKMTEVHFTVTKDNKSVIIECDGLGLLPFH